MAATLSQDELQQGLRQFTGSETFTRDPLTKLIYTEGVEYLAENAGGGAYWLITLVGSYQRDKVIQSSWDLKTFQVWTVKVDLDKHSGVVVCQKDSGRPFDIKQELEHTDFPLAEFQFYVCAGEQGPVMMLKSEY